MDFQLKRTIFLAAGDIMSGAAETLTANSTAALIRDMAAKHNVAYVPTRSDLLANDITRLLSDDVRLDEVEGTLIALQRAGYLNRNEVIHLQARYLREVKP